MAGRKAPPGGLGDRLPSINAQPLPQLCGLADADMPRARGGKQRIVDAIDFRQRLVRAAERGKDFESDQLAFQRVAMIGAEPIALPVENGRQFVLRIRRPAHCAKDFGMETAGDERVRMLVAVHALFDRQQIAHGVESFFVLSPGN